MEYYSFSLPRWFALGRVWSSQVGSVALVLSGTLGLKDYVNSSKSPTEVCFERDSSFLAAAAAASLLAHSPCRESGNDLRETVSWSTRCT